MGAVAAGHATDLWGVGLVTVGVLCAVAFYGGSLGPAGHDARVGMGDLLGWARFLLPPVLIAVGVRMLMGRGDDADESAGSRRGSSADRVRREPARAVIGGTLVLLSVSGLAALAGGSPALRASTKELSAAGGWLGAAVANPLGQRAGRLRRGRGARRHRRGRDPGVHRRVGAHGRLRTGPGHQVADQCRRGATAPG